MRGKIIVVVADQLTGAELLHALKEKGLSMEQLAAQLATTVQGLPTKEMMENLKQSMHRYELTQHYAIVKQKRPRTQKKGVDHKAYKYHKFNKGKL